MKTYYVLQGTSFIQYKQAATDKLIVLWYHRLCCTVSHNLRNKKKTIRALEVGQGWRKKDDICCLAKCAFIASNQLYVKLQIWQNIFRNRLSIYKNENLGPCHFGHISVQTLRQCLFLQVWSDNYDYYSVINRRQLL